MCGMLTDHNCLLSLSAFVLGQAMAHQGDTAREEAALNAVIPLAKIIKSLLDFSNSLGELALRHCTTNHQNVADGDVYCLCCAVPLLTGDCLKAAQAAIRGSPRDAVLLTAVARVLDVMLTLDSLKVRAWGGWMYLHHDIPAHHTLVILPSLSPSLS